jgi:hypothetical protein
MNIIGSCVVIGMILPIFWVLMFVSMLVYLKTMQIYLVTGREVKRLEALTKTPNMSHYNESITGTLSKNI